MRDRYQKITKIFVISLIALQVFWCYTMHTHMEQMFFYRREQLDDGRTR